MPKIILFSLFLIVCILGLDFFIQPGFFLYLDTIFYPIYELNGWLDKSVYFLTRDVLTFFFGYEWYSKIFLFFVLSTGAFLGYKLAQHVLKITKVELVGTQFIVHAISITFILCNPFIYERLVSQVGIAFGIFLFGIGITYLLEFIQNKLVNTLLYSAIFCGFSLSVFPHAIIFLIILGAFFILFYGKIISVKQFFVSFFIILCINLNWLIGNIFHPIQGTLAKTESFNQLNIEVFQQNKTDGFPVELSSALLYGFWGEKGNRILLPQMSSEFWYVFGIFVLGFVGLGVYRTSLYSKRLTFFLLLLLVFSYVLALGISSKYVGFISDFLYQKIPYYIGMREPAKLLGLVSIVYAFFFLMGNIFILEKGKLFFDKKNTYLYGTMILFCIFAWSPNMLWGFQKQLQILQFPDGYIQTREILVSKQLKKPLILPWHSYMGCAWNNGKVVANPMNKLIDFPDTVFADNIEIGPLYSNYKKEISQDIETFINNQDFSLLNKHNIDAIVLQKNCGLYKKYDFISSYSGVKNIFSSQDLDIFEVLYDKK